MSSPLNNPLASLSSEQLTAVFQTLSTFYSLVAVPPLVSVDASTPRSHRAAALAIAAPTLPKLKEGTYSEWAFAVGNAIRNAGLWDYISGDVTCPTDKTSKEYDLYVQECGAVRAVIIGALNHEKSFIYLGGTTTPKEAWDALKMRYHNNDDSALRAIDEQLMGIRLEEGGNIIEHIALFKKLKRELDGSKFEVDPTCAIRWMWRSLPPSYHHVVLRQQRSKVRDFDQICSELEAHYRNPVSSLSPTVTESAAPTSPPKADRKWNIPKDLREVQLTGAKNPALEARASDTCWDCLETGHKANTPQCNFYPYCIELWGGDVSNSIRTASQPIEQQVDDDAQSESTTEYGTMETAEPLSRAESPVPTSAKTPMGSTIPSPSKSSPFKSSHSTSPLSQSPPPKPPVLKPSLFESSTPKSPLLISSPSESSDRPPSFHLSPQSLSPSNPSPSPSFCSLPGVDPNPTVRSAPIPPPVSTPVPAPAPIPDPDSDPSSPVYVYPTLPTRPVTPAELRRAVQDLITAIHGGDPLDQPPDWQGPPRCFPHTPASETSEDSEIADIQEITDIPKTPDTPDTTGSQTSCVFKEFEASVPLVFSEPQATPGGTRMVNGGLLSALSLGRYSFTPWESNDLDDLLESLNASEEASPGGLGLMFELLFPGGFFDIDAALPFSREIVDLFFAWYHAVRTHNGYEMEPKRVCKCGAVTR